jgi:cytochrome subunit of sulfide dehydrogenase
MKAGWLLLLLCAPALAQDLNVARSLAATCANCHGTQGRPRGPALPPLAGMKADVMLELLADYRSGRQPGTVMPQIVKGYSEAQLRLIAGYFAAQARP